MQTVDEAADVLKLSDGSLCFVGDFDSGLFSAIFERDRASWIEYSVRGRASAHLRDPSLPTGAAHLRWGDNQKKLRTRLGQEIVILAFARQTFRLDSVGGINDVGTDLVAYVVRTEETSVSPLKIALPFLT